MVCTLQLLICLLALISAPEAARKPSLPVKPNLSGATYVGSKACATCGHEKIYNDWTISLHHMIQEPSAKTVLGDFNNQTLEHENWRFRMYKDANDAFFIQEWTPSGKENVYRVTYTLGSKRIQHYLCLLPDGSIRVAYPTWDVAVQKWIHSTEIIRGAHHSNDGMLEPLQVWNKHCWNCHTSQEKIGYDLNTDTFKTTLTETGINCEMCHGPGSLHIKRMKANPKDPDTATVNVGKFSARERMDDCIQCHDRRIVIKNGFYPGKNFYDYYIPTEVELATIDPKDPPIWAERHRKFANECLNLMDTKCYMKGNATCITCHDPHQVRISLDPRYKNTDVLCTQCHKEYLEKKAVAAHTHHSVEGKGSRCIECHMLLITSKTIKLLQNAEIRDHTISSPIPENTIKYNIPNSCNNVCHAKQSAEWVIKWMDQRYPNRARSDRRYDTFTLARFRDPKAIPLLISLMGDLNETIVARAGAARFLGEFQGEEVSAALVKALDDREVLVRAEAARSLSEAQSRSAVEPLKKKLSDRNAAVRMNAVFALLKMGMLEIQGPEAEAFKKAKAEYKQFLLSFPTIYDIRVDLGTFNALHGDFAAALEEYKNAVKLRPELPAAHYYLGITYATMGQFEPALESLQKTLEIDPKFRNTEQLIQQVKAAMGRHRE